MFCLFVACVVRAAVFGFWFSLVAVLGGFLAAVFGRRALVVAVARWGFHDKMAIQVLLKWDHH